MRSVLYHKPSGQEKMQVYHPFRSLQILAVDILAISPKSRRENGRFVVIGNTFTIFFGHTPIQRLENIA